MSNEVTHVITVKLLILSNFKEMGGIGKQTFCLKILKVFVMLQNTGWGSNLPSNNTSKKVFIVGPTRRRNQEQERCFKVVRFSN